jgi:hypothetical protein
LTWYSVLVSVTVSTNIGTATVTSTTNIDCVGSSSCYSSSFDNGTATASAAHVEATSTTAAYY